MAPNMTARLRDAGHGGQTLVLDAAVQAIPELPKDISLVLAGVHRLRGIPGDHRVHQVRHAGLQVALPPAPHARRRLGGDRARDQLPRTGGRAHPPERAGGAAPGRDPRRAGRGREDQARCRARRRDGPPLPRRGPGHRPGADLDDAVPAGRRRGSGIGAPGKRRSVPVWSTGSEKAPPARHGQLRSPWSRWVTWSARHSRQPTADGRLHESADARLPGRGDFRVEPLGRPAGDGDVLGESPAVRLFADRAAAAVGGRQAEPAEVDVVAEICRRLDGIPLALGSPPGGRDRSACGTCWRTCTRRHLSWPRRCRIIHGIAPC